jgi:tRNA(Phe) wybutosine-synthesizing methylase Tyw3
VTPARVFFEGGMTQVEQLLAERDRLLVERDQLRSLIARQFEDLAGLRRELDVLRQQLKQLREFRYRCSAAVEAEIMERLGLTPPPACN